MTYKLLHTMLKLPVVAVFLISLISMPGCLLPFMPSDPPHYEYPGEYPDLYTVATNSILGIEGEFSSRVEVVEEDFYGRKLFIYWGISDLASKRFDDPGRMPSILIAQKTEGDYVYFYPDCNFLLYESLDVTTSQNIASTEEVENLKQQNDWGRPIDESECVRAEVARRDRDYQENHNLVSEAAQEEVSNSIASNRTSRWSMFYYLTSDNYDRHIYVFRGLNQNNEYTKTYVVMFNGDGSYDKDVGIMELTDLWNYQDDLKDFKERNGWNTSPA